MLFGVTVCLCLTILLIYIGEKIAQLHTIKTRMLFGVTVCLCLTNLLIYIGGKIAQTDVSTLTMANIDSSNHFMTDGVNSRSVVGQSTNMPVYKKVYGAFQSYIYSGIIDEDLSHNHISLTFTGWQHKNDINSSFRCCLWAKNGTIIMANSDGKTSSTKGATLKAKQFRCHLETKASSVDLVTLTTHILCPTRKEWYIVPYVLVSGPKPGIAICSKIAYWAFDARFMVEWLESQMLLGVSKVLVYTYELNNDSMAVLRHYEFLGFVDVYDYDYPCKDTVPREIGAKVSQTFNDKRVAVYDCQERLRHYQYFTVMDKDEILVPNRVHLQGSLLHYLNEQFDQRPNIAAMTFQTRIHNISDVLRSSNTHIAKYIACSRSVIDRPKVICMPQRIIPGTINTHGVTPLPGFKRVSADPSLAVIHHYRKPRDSYTNQHIQLPYNETCYIMKRLGELIEKSSKNVLAQLQIK